MNTATKFNKSLKNLDKLHDAAEECSSLLDKLKCGKFFDTISEISYRLRAAYYTQLIITQAYHESLKLN